MAKSKLLEQVWHWGELTFDVFKFVLIFKVPKTSRFKI